MTIAHISKDRWGSLQRFYFRNGERCPFCNVKLMMWSPEDLPSELHPDQQVQYCQLCGWWKSDVDLYDFGWNEEITKILRPPFGTWRFTCAQNTAYLDIKSSEPQSVQLIRDHLTRNWDDRYVIHPRKLEEVVGSIFTSVGADVLVTKYSGDGGLDVIFTENNCVHGVQVKRNKNRIEVSQIRELIGSLVINGIRKGIFVTTSSFQRGVRNLREEVLKRDIDIKLIDGDELYIELINAQKYVHRRFDKSSLSPANGAHFLRGFEDGACSGNR